jgi:aspartate dehydrogenase
MEANNNLTKIRVGVVGFGNLGKYLVDAILNNEKAKEKFELVFIWNRSVEKIGEKYSSFILKDLKDFAAFKPHLIIEVSHPKIVQEWGLKFLEVADLIVGSPTAFADENVEKQFREATKNGNHGCYVPSGALWGAEDIHKMADVNTLLSLSVTMKKHPASLKLEEPLKSKVDEFLKDEKSSQEKIIYEGPVRQLCPLAPNNVNTMACASLAAHNLGFDKVVGRLVADKGLDAHVIEICVGGPKDQFGEFQVNTTRFNPAKVGAVTGNLTYSSFLASLLRSHGRGSGFHFV